MNKQDFKDAVRAANKSRQLIPTEFFGQPCFVREFHGQERAQLARHQMSGRLPDDWFGLIVVRALCDEAGERIYNDGEASEVSRLPGKELMRITRIAMELNGLDGEAIEDEEKNSDAIPS